MPFYLTITTIDCSNELQSNLSWKMQYLLVSLAVFLKKKQQSPKCNNDLINFTIQRKIYRETIDRCKNIERDEGIGIVIFIDVTLIKLIKVDYHNDVMLF